MIEVEGIILVLSCQKHQNTRLKKFVLKNEYNNWKVIYVIGDLFLDEEYKLVNDNYLYIRCEDSYIHLLKKLTLSIKYVNKIFNIKQGILRSGDDLIFNEEILISFLKGEKCDYYGQSHCGNDYYCNDKNLLKKTLVDTFMYDYYKNHPEDFDNPHHNLKGKDIKNYLVRPDIFGASGVLYYLSNRACNILINHMEKINYDIFHYDEFTKSYPYTIEDCAVTFIMYYNDVKFKHNGNFYQDVNVNNEDLIRKLKNNNNTICFHTNFYK